ncbi:hypothetical protein XaplCFBP3122_18700 [Xanthomonas arboricola pv. populi]|uniref:DUF2628 domain-containing protein n=1 Tax=Xanthomonas arboricola pv. populi TaxID=487823 RepID=A0A2S6Z055_9XANT|nr:hypothetical protein [Xanthomonas arboricola]PPT73902.1 hypothetical protein XaplCFBP3122_18700 [Xanthomonas arboricola pv. populi]
MVEPAAPKSTRAATPATPPATPPADAWPADSPLDPAINRFRGAPCYQVWQRRDQWTAVAEGTQWSAGLAPRWWALRQRHWRLLATGVGLLALAAGLASLGLWTWSLPAWAALLLAELGLRVQVARQAGPWRSAALRRAGWQAVTRLRAISVADAVTTAQIRAGRLPR